MRLPRLLMDYGAMTLLVLVVGRINSVLRDTGILALVE